MFGRKKLKTPEEKEAYESAYKSEKEKIALARRTAKIDRAITLGRIKARKESLSLREKLSNIDKGFSTAQKRLQKSKHLNKALDFFSLEEPKKKKRKQQFSLL